jgi:hypothetical protein
LTLDHVSELHGADAELVYLIFELFKLLVNDIHDVLLALGSVGQVLVMTKLAQVNSVAKQEALDVSRNPQDAVLSQTINGKSDSAARKVLDPVVKVDVKLGPS